MLASNTSLTCSMFDNAGHLPAGKAHGRQRFPPSMRKIATGEPGRDSSERTAGSGFYPALAKDDTECLFGATTLASLALPGGIHPDESRILITNGNLVQRRAARRRGIGPREGS